MTPSHLPRRRAIARFVAALMLAAPLPLAAQALPTGQSLTPLAAPGARFQPLTIRTGPMPQAVADGAAAMAVSPDGRELLVLTSGFNVFNGADGKPSLAQSQQWVFRYRLAGRAATWLQSIPVPNSYGGLAWRADGSGFVVGGGVDDALYLFARAGGQMAASGKVALGHAAGLGNKVKPQAAGVALSPDGRCALVANYYNDSVSLVDLATQRVVAEQDLRPGKVDAADGGMAGGSFPLSVVWGKGGRAWVSAPRDREIVALEMAGDAIRVAGRTPVSGEPTALLIGAKGTRLFATQDNADRLAVIDTGTGKLLAEPRIVMPAGLGTMAQGGAALPKGLNPDALAELPDGRLLVSLGGANAVAVVAPDAGGIAVQGLVPTAWYPSALATSRDGRQVFVANRKSPPGPNPQGCAPELAIYRGQKNACGAANQYIFQLEKAGLLAFPLPAGKALAATSLQVARNLGLDGAERRAAAEAVIASIRPQIRHVVFIIKENRTYDQVLGDLERGNGDKGLAILGEHLSPNHHKLAREFVTLDNFRVSGEQSSTGWTWSTAARVPDLLERTAPVNYADRGLGYEAEEADRFIYTQQTMAERHATNPALDKDRDLLPGPALLTAPDAPDHAGMKAPAPHKRDADDEDDDDVANKGFLWNAAVRAGLSLRNYGFSDATVYDVGAPGAVPPIREPFKEGRRVYTPGDRVLGPRSDPYFSGFDQKLADLWREQEWEREYAEMEGKGTLPALTLLRLSHDHFGDFATAIDGVNTVETQMADNDYALGRVVERIARGKAADSTLVFVIEDDAQNGADHVDARRSPVFVVGPYVRHGALVSTPYTTVDVLRTIEAFLGLPALGLNDALATPMADLFDPMQKDWSYKAVAAPVLRTTQLPIPPERYAAATGPACSHRSAGWWAAAMQGQDFGSEDRLDTRAFNAALWRGLGTGPEPAPGTGSRDEATMRRSEAASWTCEEAGKPLAMR